MSKMLRAWSRWLSGVVLPPHRIWSQPFEDGEAEIRLHQPIYFWILVGLFILYGFMPVKVVVICLVTTIGVLITGYIWVRYMTRHVYAIRKLRYAAVQVGDELEEDICVRNTGWLPVLWIGVQDQSDFPAYSIGVVRGLSADSKAEWRVNLICKQRGVFSLGPWNWISSDPFGIFHVQRSYRSAQRMVVYPPMAVVSQDLMRHGKQSGDLRPLNQPLRAESVQATQTRAYQPGDPLRRIHWRTTARHGSLYVKSFDPEAASRIWLVPDFDPLVHNFFDSKSESWEDSTEETTILLLAALAGQLLDDQRSVGLYAGVEPAQVVMPQRGTAHLWSILTSLAPIHTTQCIPFAENLTQARKLISASDLIIAVTPSMNVDWIYTLAKVSRSYGINEAWAYILDPKSFEMNGDSSAITSVAAEFGIATRMVKKGDVQALAGGMGTLRKWEYLTTGTGRTVVRNRPRLAEDLETLQMGKWT